RIAIEKEIEYLRNYIELEGLRLEDNANVKFEIENESQGLEIAPLLLLPLLENAFKHGTTNSERIDIQIFIQVNPQKDELRLEVKNYFEPNDKKAGLGIENLQKRLDLMYANRYDLQQTIQNDLYISILKLQL
ncbi:MAG: histidine kinase, partial [Bacteroidota bacterium]